MVLECANQLGHITEDITASQRAGTRNVILIIRCGTVELNPMDNLKPENTTTRKQQRFI